MGINDQCHALVMLNPWRKDPQYPLDKRPGGPPDPVCMQRLEEKSIAPARD
jgi:hypothetical protein